MQFNVFDEQNAGENNCTDSSIKEPYFVEVGERFNLTCEHVVGENIAWFFNNVPLDSLHEDSIINDGTGVLTFPIVSLDHAGWYTCTIPTVDETQKRIEIDYLLVVEG